jgi:hypothetical protein
LKPLKATISRFTYFIIFQGFSLILIMSCAEKNNPIKDNNRVINDSELRMTLPNDAQQLDPTESIVSNELLLRQVFEGLIELSGDGYIKSALVESMIIDSTKKSINFQLKNGIRFSNGANLDSASLAEWIYDKQQLGFEISIKRNSITIGYNKINDNTALKTLSSHKMLIYNKLDNNYIGTGAFEIDNFDPGSFISFTANKYYFDKDYPKVKRLKIQFSDNALFSINNFVELENDLLFINPEATIHPLNNIDLMQYKSNTKIDSSRNECTYAIMESTDSVIFSVLKSKFVKLDLLPKTTKLRIIQVEDSLYKMAFDSIPILVTDNSFFSNIVTQQLLFGAKGLPTDSSRYLQIFSLKNLQNPHDLTEVISKTGTTFIGEEGKSLVLLNSQYGKIVYQYYIKNIEYINNEIVDFKKLELQKAEKLN